MSHNPIGWVEIPVADMDRAIEFYQKVFDCEIARHQMGPIDMGWLPNGEGGGCTGSLVKHEMYSPSESAGPLVYWSCEDVDTELARVEEAGGKIVEKKTNISPDHGFYAIFIDCEGNRMAMHSNK